MNSQIKAMFSDAEGRYLEDQEIGQLTDYMASLEARLAAMRAVEQAEAKIVEETLDVVWETHPDFASKYYEARKNCTRDVSLALRYCALAMVRDDIDMLREKLLYWLRTILNAFEFGQALDTTYRALARRVEANLDPQSVRLLAPYLRETHQILTSDPLNQ